MRMNPEETNKRQDIILEILNKKGRVFVSQILKDIKLSLGEVSKITINRDLNKLIKIGFVKRGGIARAVFYELSPQYNLFKRIDPEKYFSVKTDERIIKEIFNFKIFSILKNIFGDSEKKYLYDLNSEYQNNTAKISGEIAKREFERLTIELSWKSSQIEGNTYSLLETESLIKEKKEATGHKKEEATMILNHKKAFDYIYGNKNKFRTVSISKIEDTHYLLTKDLGISRNLRKVAVGVVGTKYKPLDNEFQINEALSNACDLINKEKNAFCKAVAMMILIAYIQPFEDGNKRTSRFLGNAILMAHGACPLSYRSVDETEYKKAVIIFYEQNNLGYFKKLFIEQFEFAVKNYFRVSI